MRLETCDKRCETGNVTQEALDKRRETGTFRKKVIGKNILKNTAQLRNFFP